ncbi:hypothetical protein L3Y34_008150 [Caenorhabditis briggsae]|uniref:Uncharacterized protein n=1 Tax=Caenorhabditis briggsae TaxID=6238 RepID=A0AAE9D0Q6_CAEBR|nr:hypothetical protein L3Y34_008150 [Caenorhabditis briggsae]
MKIWCLSILILSNISFVSNGHLNTCAAIDKTSKDLSDVVALFVRFKWSPDDHTQKNKSTNSKSSVLNEVMERFFYCYGASGRLEVRSVVFEKYINSTNDCVLSQKQILPNKYLFKDKIVRVIEFPAYIENCGNASARSENIRDLVQEAEIVADLKIAMCYDHILNKEDCKNMKFLGLEMIPVGHETLFYETLEKYIDNLPSIYVNITTESGNLISKYKYFSSVSNNFVLWPSFFAILTVILFFFGSVFLCCCGLGLFALVEEDFQKRNEERDWLALQVRRNEDREVYAVSPALSQNGCLATAISKHSTSNLETAKSNTSSSKSSSSSDVVTDSTQPTETEPLVPPDQKLKQI